MHSAGNTSAPLYGVAAEFGSAHDLYEAAKTIRSSGYHHFDVFSPFPIHGMSVVMKLRPSPIGKLVFVGGLAGFLTAVALQFIPSSFIYPLIVMGKPTNLFTVPAFFPIMFELTILFAAFTAVIGMLVMNGLPRWNHPLFNWDRFQEASNDRFFAIIETADPKFSEADAASLLESLGGTNITRVHED